MSKVLRFFPQYLGIQHIIDSTFLIVLYPDNLVTCYAFLNANFLRKPWPHTSEICVVWCNRHNYRSLYDTFSYRNDIKLLPYDEIKHECLRYESTLRSCKLRGNLPNLALLLLFLTNVVESHSITQWQVMKLNLFSCVALLLYKNQNDITCNLNIVVNKVCTKQKESKHPLVHF